jgi:hypothetical protein
MVRIGEHVEIISGEFSGCGGTVVSHYDGGYEVLIGGYRVPVPATDIAPDLVTVAKEAIAFLEACEQTAACEQVLARLRAAVCFCV